MNRHVARRVLVVLGIAGLLLLGVFHPENAWARPIAAAALFLAVFAAAILIVPSALEDGRKTFEHWGRFLATSELLLMLAVIGHAALTGLAMLSWPEMSMLERILVPFFAVAGFAGGWREMWFGLRSDREQARRDDWHRRHHTH